MNKKTLCECFVLFWVYGNECTKFRSENNKRAETGFMVKAWGKRKTIEKYYGLTIVAKYLLNVLRKTTKTTQRERAKKRKKTHKTTVKNTYTK